MNIKEEYIITGPFNFYLGQYSDGNTEWVSIRYKEETSDGRRRKYWIKFLMIKTKEGWICASYNCTPDKEISNTMKWRNEYILSSFLHPPKVIYNITQYVK